MRVAVRSVTALGLAVYLAVSGVTYAVYAAGGLWEPLLVLYPVSAYLIWRLAAGKSLAQMGLGRFTGYGLQLAAALVVASLLAASWLILLSVTGVRTVGLAPSPGAMALIAPLLLGPLVAGLLTAVPEEFVHRGFLLGLLSSWPGKAWALIASSALFAAGHLPTVLDGGLPVGPHLAVKLAVLFVFGLLMAWTVLETGGLWFAIGWHAGSNYPRVVEQFLFREGEPGPAWLVGHPAGGLDTGLLGLLYAGIEVLAVLALLSVITRKTARGGAVTGAS